MKSNARFQLFLSVLTTMLSFALVLVSPVSSSPAPVVRTADITLGLNLPASFEFVGSTDDKFYFADSFAHWNWTAAKTKCESSNLDLATVKTRNEVDVLREGLRDISKYIYYWVSARERKEPSLLQWEDGTGDLVDGSLIDNWKPGSEHFYCGLLHFNFTEGAQGEFELSGYDCKYPYGRLLCELQLESVGK